MNRVGEKSPRVLKVKVELTNTDTITIDLEEHSWQAALQLKEFLIRSGAEVHVLYSEGWRAEK